MSSITDWLTPLGLSEYADRFVANAIDVSVLGELTEQDLKDLNIPLGHRRKLLRAIADVSHSSPPPGQTESATDDAQRRQLTVMFCDLVGSTALSAAHDPEDTRRVISTYQGCIAAVVARHNGMIARYMGDGALIYFGYPHAHEDDAEQALHAGLELVEAIPTLKTGIDTALQACIGVATGTVVIGDLLTTEAGVREHAVVGDPPNLAARLQTVAQPGTIVVCANTRQLTDGYFVYRDLGGVALKGWSHPISTWQPLRATGIESRFEAQHQAKLMPLLGRDEEVEMLSRRWRSAKQGEGRAVLLIGEPGIGKSHISLAFEGLLQFEPHGTRHYVCSSHHANSALFPHINQLQRAAQFERGDPPATRLSKLESLIGPAGHATDHAVALLSNLLSLPANPKYPMPPLDSQRQKEETLKALLGQLQIAAAGQPILMVFEDIHWIDPTSLELLAMTIERLPAMRVLLLMTARPEFVPPWPGHAHISTVLLTRLSRRDGAALVERVTGGKRLPEEVLSQILSRTDGVPLFVEELTKTVLESGYLQERSDQYVLEHSQPSLAIPSTLHASLMARLDRLAPVRDVAQIAAVIGREFSYDLLSAVAGLPKEKLDDALEQLTHSELIFRRGVNPHAVYTFKHALIRDAAYEGLLKSRRVQLHAALANAFEQRFPEIVETQPETAAHHLTEAGLTEKALQYWLLAGTRAAQRSAHLEAVAHLERGMEALQALPATPERDRIELSFLMAKGPCLIASQGPAGKAAVANFIRARRICEKLGDPPEFLQVMFWLVTASVMRGELPLARETIGLLLQRAEQRRDRPALINAKRGKAMILMFMGQLSEAATTIADAFETFNKSSETEQLKARAAGQDAGVADLALMSWTLWLLGQPDSAVERIEAALRRADTIAHPHTHAYASYYAAVLYAFRGQFNVARAHSARCCELSKAHEFRQWRGLSQTMTGICDAFLGSQSSVSEVTTALDDYRNAGYQLGITALYALLCSALLVRGDREGALEILDLGLSTVQNNSERIFEAELYRLKARAQQDAGDAAAVANQVALLEQALELARSQHAKSIELRVARDLAQTLLRHGESQRARELLAPICDWFTEGSETSDLREARAILATL